MIDVSLAWKRGDGGWLSLPAERGDIIKPGVEQSGTPRFATIYEILSARSLRQRKRRKPLMMVGCRPLRGLQPGIPRILGFRSAQPRLYAVAALRGLR